MISISMVVCMLVVLLAFKEHSLQVKYQANENRKSQLEEEITTEEIEEITEETLEETIELEDKDLKDLKKIINLS